MLYFRVRNFEQFQHYKHRNPPWIRLYYALLHDRRFYRLDDASKWLAVGIFLLASQHENKIAFDEEWIEKELSLSTKPNWQALLDAEFIQPIDCDASTLLATCKHLASQSRVDNTDNTDNTETEILSKSRKYEILAASEIFKYWNTQPKLMHHRSMNGQERAILSTLKHYTSEEINCSIERYSLVRQNLEGKYRDIYQWTLGEFLSRDSHKNIERFNAEDWEQPFLNMNRSTKIQDNTDWLYRDEEFENGKQSSGAVCKEPEG